MRIKVFVLTLIIFFIQLSYVFATEISTELLDIKEITLSFVGDCLLGSDLSYGKSGSFIDVFEKQKGNYNYFFENVKPVFENDDLTIANLENPLTNATLKAEKEFAFKGFPEFSNILKSGFIDAVNIENNHTYDYFKVGNEDTKKALTESEIGFFGASDFYITTIKDIKIGFIAYKGWAYTKEMQKQILAGIKNLKDNGVSIIAISFHWGEERNNYPIDAQKQLAKFSIDNGVDIVIGHHPHVIQGIEIYNEKPIVYSLGNFCFGGNRNPPDKDTFIFQHTFKLIDGEKDSTYSKIIPCSVTSVKNYNDFRPTPLKDLDAIRVLERLLLYSKNLNSDEFIKNSFYVYK